jgi:hypothetical protein
MPLHLWLCDEPTVLAGAPPIVWWSTRGFRIRFLDYYKSVSIHPLAELTGTLGQRMMPFELIQRSTCIESNLERDFLSLELSPASCKETYDERVYFCWSRWVKLSVQSGYQWI